MANKVSSDTKWKVIGGIIISILGFVVWYYQAHHDMDDGHHGEQEGTIQPINTEKSDIEIYTEVAKEGVELATEIGKNMKENKQRKDSIYEAEREKRWVFQIGDIANNEDAILELYQQLKDLDGLSVFKESRRSFFLFKDDGKAKQELEKTSGDIKAQVLKATSRVVVIDLMEKCKKRESVKKTDDLIFKKKKVKISCYECSRR